MLSEKLANFGLMLFIGGIAIGVVTRNLYLFILLMCLGLAVYGVSAYIEYVFEK